MTHYEILGITQDTEPSDVKKAFRKLSMKYHPDIPTTGDAERFMKIQKAYDVLSDPDERTIYDAELKGDSKGKSEFRPGESTDVFSNVFNTRKEKDSARRGQNRTANLTVSLVEATTGVLKDITIRISEPCVSCRGTGKKEPDKVVCQTCGGTRKVVTESVNPFGHTAKTTRVCQDCKNENQQEEECEDCRGIGSKRVPLTVPVNITAGVENNSKIRVKGCGERGINGGEDGDLIVTVTVENDSQFVRVGNDLHLQQKVSYTQLVLGDKLEVESLEGTTELIIPKGTHPGTELRLKGQGMPGFTDTRRGDLVVTLELIIPTDLTPEQEQLLRSLDF